MAVGPSSNLLSALSQLQNTRPIQPARAPQAAQNTGAAAQTTSTQKTSFAAQLGSIGNSIQVASEQRSAPPPAVQTQQRPIQTRGGLIGQHVNIVV
ncbi:hypothetical protein FNB15_10915 [Ferrovibrio terrae]|uniref:Uncharacterized protein n=1 Tax=Ferrovibrio terrae TaxID=2594003 RepID=A0A516H1U8_9PROT|nr:hypothetical protein [Ferrovibrio terrae]QDO97747.1 hypothetical protein FNB15_10915 [Ferrovibrio terrae]